MKWLQLDTDFLENEKIKTLQYEHGSNGVMIYLYIILQVAYKIDIDNENNGFFETANRDYVQYIAYENRLDTEKVQAIIDTCVDIELLEIKDDKLFVASLLERKNVKTFLEKQQWGRDHGRGQKSSSKNTDSSSNRETNSAPIRETNRASDRETDRNKIRLDKNKIRSRSDKSTDKKKEKSTKNKKEKNEKKKKALQIFNNYKKQFCKLIDRDFVETKDGKGNTRALTEFFNADYDIDDFKHICKVKKADPYYRKNPQYYTIPTLTRTTKVDSKLDQQVDDFPDNEGKAVKKTTTGYRGKTKVIYVDGSEELK